MERDVFERIAKVLADPKRFEILQMIAESSEFRCADFKDRVGLSQPTVSHHLKELAGSGLLIVTREGAGNRYEINRELLAAYLTEVARRLSSSF